MHSRRRRRRRRRLRSTCSGVECNDFSWPLETHTCVYVGCTL